MRGRAASAARRERLGAEGVLDLLFGQRPVAGDEIAEHGVLRVADRRVERGRRAGGGPDLLRLLQRQVRLVGDLLERRLAAELAQSERSARFIFCSRSTMWTGMRIVRALSASARATAWRIHQVAYVENL